MREPDAPRTADEAATLNEFLAALLADRAAGRSLPVEHYLDQFPRHRDRIAVEFAALSGAEATTRLPVIPQVEIEGEIARGGQGIVYRARQTYLGRTVAVKVLAETPVDGQFTKRFRREARTLAGLTHPNIVTCHDAGVAADGTCYLVMEFIDGPTLRRWLDEHGPLPAAAALAVARDLASALAHALAAGIVHRDVKPENVLLQPLPDARTGSFPFRAKLVDLGLARPVRLDLLQSQATPVGLVLGTPETMAPEQFDDPDAVDHRADIYGLGCVLYHALTGQPAFRQRGIMDLMAHKAGARAPDPRQVASQVAAPVAELVMHMLARRPAARPADWASVLRSLDRLLAAPSASGWRGRRLLLTAVLASVAGIASAFWWRRTQDPPANAPPAPLVLRPIVLFGAGEDPFAGWQGAPLHDDDGRPSLNHSSGIGEARRDLPCTVFELQGGLAPIGRFEAGATVPVERAGVRLEFADGRGLELDLQPRDGGYRAAWRSLSRTGPGAPWTVAATSSAADGTWSAAEVLSFRVRTGVVAGRMEVAIGTGGAARTASMAAGSGQATLVLYVAGGCASFPDLRLTGN